MVQAPLYHLLITLSDLFASLKATCHLLCCAPMTHCPKLSNLASWANLTCRQQLYDSVLVGLFIIYLLNWLNLLLSFIVIYTQRSWNSLKTRYRFFPPPETCFISRHIFKYLILERRAKKFISGSGWQFYQTDHKENVLLNRSFPVA